MEASLHGHDPFPGEVAEYEVAAMAFDGRDGEVGNLGIGDYGLLFDEVGDRAEACAEDDGDFGHVAHFGAEEISCLVDFF